MPHSPPDYSRLPAVVIRAELRRGTLLRCGPGVRSPGWPDCSRVRAAALAPWWPVGHVAIGGAAAWIWGACRDPGRPLHFAAPRPRRSHVDIHPMIRTHEYEFAAHGDLVDVGDGRVVTTPERTVFDLLTMEDAFADAHRVACRIMLLTTPDARARAGARLQGARPTMRTRALHRLAAL